jgi:hypothetical protein
MPRAVFFAYSYTFSAVILKMIFCECCVRSHRPMWLRKPVGNSSLKLWCFWYMPDGNRLMCFTSFHYVKPKTRSVNIQQQLKCKVGCYIELFFSFVTFVLMDKAQIIPRVRNSYFFLCAHTVAECSMHNYYLSSSNNEIKVIVNCDSRTVCKKPFVVLSSQRLHILLRDRVNW